MISSSSILKQIGRGMGSTPNDVIGNLRFLARNLDYETTEPYVLHFTPDDGSPSHNLSIEERNISISDARQINPSLEKNGFCLSHVPTKMRFADFKSRTTIERIYKAEILGHLKTTYSVNHVKLLDYTVSYDG